MAASDLLMAATVPRPIQVVIDDVGWWSGEDGHTRNEPFSTGMPRNHVPEDYEAIAELGRRLGIRPLAAMVLCEWDRDNILRREPTCTWQGKGWDNARWRGPWLEQAAEVFQASRNHITLAVHGTGHEFWQDGIIERAEWHDVHGRMRPAGTVRRHLDLFGGLLEQNGLGSFPEYLVPAAFLHRFGTEEDGFASIAAEYGIEVISTPFHTMHRDREQETPLFGIDHGVLTIDRGADLCSWDAAAPEPQGAITGVVCGMHWPNLLHIEPARNAEVVERWVRFLTPCEMALDTMLSPTPEAWVRQTLAREEVSLGLDADVLRVHIHGYSKKPARCSDMRFAVRVQTAEPVSFMSEDHAEFSVRRIDTPMPGCIHELSFALNNHGPASRREIRLNVTARSSGAPR